MKLSRRDEDVPPSPNTLLDNYLPRHLPITDKTANAAAMIAKLDTDLVSNMTSCPHNDIGCIALSSDRCRFSFWVNGVRPGKKSPTIAGLAKRFFTAGLTLIRGTMSPEPCTQEYLTLGTVFQSPVKEQQINIGQGRGSALLLEYVVKYLVHG